MVRATIFCSVVKRYTLEEVVRGIGDYSEVEKVSEIFGPYDLVIETSADGLPQFSDFYASLLHRGYFSRVAAYIQIEGFSHRKEPALQ